MFNLIIDEKYKTSWNKVVTHPLQTWEWGEVKGLMGLRVMRVGEFNNSGKLCNGYLFTIHNLPLGYVMVNYARGIWPSSEVIHFVKKELGKKCIFIKLEPEVFIEQAGIVKIPILLKNWRQDKLEYVLSSSRVFAQHTFVVATALHEEKLLENMKPKTRYNIRLAEKKGVVVKDMTMEEKGFADFFSLYTQTIKRQNYLGHGYEYHKNVFEKMRTYSRLLVAYYEGKPLAAYHLMFFNKTGYYVYGGSSEEHKEAMASNLLMWEALKLAKKLGCISFDMWGALPSTYNPKDPWSGFHHFKEGYGGVHKDYIGSVDVVVKPFEYKLFAFLWPLRTKMLEFKQKLTKAR